MTAPVLEAAKRLCERSGWSLSNLEVQKLLYLSHMYHLGRHNEPLVSGHFEAWDYGPVQPSLYHNLKIFGKSPVQNIFHTIPDIEEGDESQMIDEVVEQLGHARPGKLVAITHWESGAWAKNYVPGSQNIVIPNADIFQEYRDRVDAAAARK